jgi:hypothetical protein
MLRKLFFVVVAALAVLGMACPSQAVLNAVDLGPYEVGYGFFPKWYQDTFGRALELCLSPAEIAANERPGLAGGAACTLLANPGIFDPAQPIVFPSNFPDESFWFMADAAIVVSGIDLQYGAALEAAFGGGDPAPNDQVSFARIRIRVTLPDTAPAGTYTVTHPYGVEVFDVLAGGIKVINMTRDIGIGAPGDFTGALKGDIGPFLVDATVPTLGPIPAGTELFIGDPNTPREVVGSPFGTNFVRIEGPGGFATVETILFNVMGKVFPGQFATPLVIDRTSYSRSSTGGDQTDVFVKAPPTGTAEFTDTAGTPTPMASDAFGQFFGQSTAISVTALSPGNTSTTKSSDLVDLVTITRAEYTGGALTVEAASSDEVDPPELTVNGQPMALVGGTGPLRTVTISGLTIPPARVTVTSANGGNDTEEVVLLP